MNEPAVSDRYERREWWCRLTLQCLAASFAAVGTIFVVLPDATIGALNAVGSSLGDFAPAPKSALRFWLSLATGYMVLVTALAYLAQQDLRRRRMLVALLALGKLASALTCLAYYLFSLDAFIYLANFLVDGSIAVAAAAIWIAVRPLEMVPMSEPATAHPRRDQVADRALAAIAEAMVPSGGPFEEGARDSVTLEMLESFAAAAGPQVPAALRLLVRLMDVSPRLLPPFHLRRLSRLPLDERVRCLESWEHSRLAPRRQAMRILKQFVMLHFYSHPEIAARLGYPNPLERVPRSEGPAA